MRISLSIDRILDQIYARTALRHHLDAERPPLLTADRRPALVILARSSFGILCTAMLPHITDCNIDDTESPLMTLDIDTAPDASPVALRLLIENAVTSRTLAEAYTGTDPRLATTLTDAFNADIDALRRMLRLPAGPVTLRPAWL